MSLSKKSYIILGVTLIVVLVLLFSMKMGPPEEEGITGNVIKEEKQPVADCHDKDMNGDGVVNALDLARCANK